ncbi:MAG TPA: ATP-grasp domain-containing protein [Candidatus Lokiarchaeia archaeon]|nr:ATP-grasp domain-containing protein [Candidatus Lokiarchaeia archaeon]
MEKTIIVAGFNCRPIAEACVKAGFQPEVIDYFGDLDIRSIAKGHYFMEENHESGDVDAFRRWVLTKIEREVPKPGKGVVPSRDKPWIIAGSGFDDEPYFWKRFAELGTLIGNSARNVQQARNLVTLAKVIKENEVRIEIPRTKRVIIEKNADLVALFDEIRQRFSFPFLMKRSRTAGGTGIDFIDGDAAIKAFIDRVLGDIGRDPHYTETYNVQDYVGSPGSRDISVIACNDRVVCKTLQIIGDTRLHAPKRFSYCGNIIPLEPMEASLENTIERLVKTLHDSCGLRGIYGIDFVQSNGKLYLAEVNPRIPGSLEPASIALVTNLINDHVKSFMKGKQARGLAGHRYEPKYQVIKLILFASQEFTMPTLDRVKIAKQLHDITLPGIKMTPGMPVLTYLHRGSLDTPEENELQAWQDVDTLYKFFSGD